VLPILVKSMPIRTPLLHIAVHVIEAEAIRLLLPHGMRLATAVLLVPTILLQEAVRGLVLSVREERPASRSTGILPFRLCGQANALPPPLRELVAELHRIMPSNLLNGSLGPFVVTGIPAHDPLVLLLSHLVDAYVEGPGDLHIMLRCGRRAAEFVKGGWVPHQEFASGN
jgi:hypothetical protein